MNTNETVTITQEAGAWIVRMSGILCSTYRTEAGAVVGAARMTEALRADAAGVTVARVRRPRPVQIRYTAHQLRTLS